VGDDTTVAKPICALPRDVWLTKWKKQSIARGKKIELSFKNKTVICELRDTLPPTAKIKNGAGIDLNPGTAKALGLKPPFCTERRLALGRLIPPVQRGIGDPN
jgi:hypothetical protein